MAALSDRQPRRRHRLVIHLVLLTGAVFFLLPLLWMIATSLKPADQTLQKPESFVTALVGTGYHVEIDGREYEVTRRQIDLAKEGPLHIVRPRPRADKAPAFLAGELTLSFGPDTWKDILSFADIEREQMNTAITAAVKVLADRDNRYDPVTGKLHLRSGRVVEVDLVRKIDPPADRSTLYLVREWRPADTDTKALSSQFIDVRRAWDIVGDNRIRSTPKIVPTNYPVALRHVHFTRSLGNTLLVCVMAVCGTVISSVIVAYGFAFIAFPGRNALFAVTLTTIMVPFVVTMVPMYLLYRNLGWVGSFKPLWVATWFGNAFFIFLLRQFFLGIPKDLLDAARIDGCSELEILWNVVVPLSRPVIAMVALFTFLGAWKDFLGPLIYLNHEKQFTLSLSLQAFSSAHGGTPWHLLMAAATVFSLPLIVLFFFAMKTFIRSVAMTGIKG